MNGCTNVISARVRQADQQKQLRYVYDRNNPHETGDMLRPVGSCMCIAFSYPSNVGRDARQFFFPVGK